MEELEETLSDAEPLICAEFEIELEIDGLAVGDRVCDAESVIREELVYDTVPVVDTDVV
jgi:hypothetical protein